MQEVLLFDLHIIFTSQYNIIPIHFVLLCLFNPFKSELKQIDNSLTDFDELELSDFDGPVRVCVGDTFSHFSIELAREQVEKKRATLMKQIAELKEQQDKRNEEMLKLKANLNAKFGKSINLEDDE